MNMQPPLKWAGGKRRLVPHLAPLWEAHRHRRLVEPFCGGLAVTMGLLPDRALLNDRNPCLMAFCRLLQSGFQTDLHMENTEALYKEHRDTFNGLVAAGRGESREAAALFYYLNRTGFNGLCRVNRKGKFNVPVGGGKTIPYIRDFTLYQALFARWRFTTGDFEALALEPDDFIYADPPFDGGFTGYTREGFGWEDQQRLAAWLARHPGPVVLSNKATPRIRDLYELLGFTLRTLSAPRQINCTGDRTPALEVLATRGLELLPETILRDIAIRQELS